MAARSEPQMPLSDGITRTQFEAGRTGSGTSPSLSIDSDEVATSGRPPAARTSANDGIERTYWIASVALPRDIPASGGRASASASSLAPSATARCASRAAPQPATAAHPGSPRPAHRAVADGARELALADARPPLA